jgi:hypothetical protein
MPPRSTSVLGALAVTLLLAAASAERAHAQVDPQPNELSAFVEIAPSNDGIFSIFTAQYTRFFPPLDRKDEVVPILRRFVRHPSEVYLRFERLGSQSDSRTALVAGGTLQLLDGRVYGTGELGIAKEDIAYDDNEGGYVDAPFRLEVGGRPLELLSLGAVYLGRPIVATTDPDAAFRIPAERSGTDQFFGGRLAYATATDRFFLNLTAGYRYVDWTFTGFHPGALTAKGPRVDLLLSLQTSRSVSWQLGLMAAREEWDNERIDDDDDDYVGEDTSRTVDSFQGEGAFVYWFEGRYGFRLSLGGGFRGEEPIYYRIYYNAGRDDLYYGKLGIGVLGRF